MFKFKQSIKPLFFINISDIEELKEKSFYLACNLNTIALFKLFKLFKIIKIGTTEDIFENKKNLYDIFIKDTNLIAVLNENQKSLLKVNSMDKRRYDNLIKKLRY